MIHNLVSSIGFRLDEFIKNKLSISEDSVGDFKSSRYEWEHESRS